MMKYPWSPTLVLAGLLALPLFCFAGEWDFSGDIEVENRLYTQGEALPGQDSTRWQAALGLELDWRWRSESGNQRISIIPFLRADAVDSERSHVDLREAYWAIEGDTWELLAGVNKVFWGVTESRHLVDIINQTDLLEDLDQEDKLGQPMVNLNLQRDWGLVSFYLLPYFRERTFPGADGRLRTPLPVATERALYESAAEQNHTDFALRYSHYFGDVDIGVYYFKGTGREPRLLVNSTADALLPAYDQIEQVGVDLQYTRDAWLWKLETILRDGVADTFYAATAGLEYTFYQIAGSGKDLGVLLEYSRDQRGFSEPPTLFDDDWFIGARLTFNDSQDTAVLAGLAVDPSTSELFINLEAETRIGDSVTAELRVRFFTGAASNEPLFAIQRDDYVQLSLAKYF